jgi:hypothetical protein
MELAVHEKLILRFWNVGKEMRPYFNVANVGICHHQKE